MRDEQTLMRWRAASSWSPKVCPAPWRHALPEFRWGGRSQTKTDDSAPPSLGGVRVSVLLFRVEEQSKRPVNSVRADLLGGFSAEGNRRFHPAAAGQKSDEERLDFLVLRRYVRALSLCLLDFEHVIVTLDETFLYQADCSFTSACAHLSGLTASLLAQNVGHPATRPPEALARGSGGQRPIPWAGVDRPRGHALQDSMETRHETYAAARGRGHHI